MGCPESFTMTFHSIQNETSLAHGRSLTRWHETNDSMNRIHSVAESHWYSPVVSPELRLPLMKPSRIEVSDSGYSALFHLVELISWCRCSYTFLPAIPPTG
jgi:hypothetical protein